MQKGLFAISIDLELAWGACDLNLTKDHIHALFFERKIVNRLLKLLKKYDIRASWGVVGHMLEYKNFWERGVVHPEIPRPIIFGESIDWFGRLSDSTHNSIWYGKDIIQLVKSFTPEQEIGSHSFCHMPYCERTTNPNAVEADIRLAKEFHDANGLPFNIFIFPRNKIGFRDLLVKYGIKVYRGNTLHWFDNLPVGFLRRFINLLYYILAVSPKTVRIEKDEFGLINIPDSMLLTARNGLRRLIPPSNIIRMAKAGLNRAIEKKEIFHLWFHPSNFAYNTESQLDILEEILQRAFVFREEGLLDQKTMGEIAKNV